MLGELLKVGLDDARCHRAADALAAEILDLDQQAFAEIASRDANRLERLEDGENQLDLVNRNSQLVGRFVSAALKVAIIVEVADEVGCDCHRPGRQHRLKLVEESLRQAHLRRDLSKRVEVVFGRWRAEIQIIQIVVGIVVVVVGGRRSRLLLAQAGRADTALHGPAARRTGFVFDELHRRIFRDFLSNRLLQFLR